MHTEKKIIDKKYLLIAAAVAGVLLMTVPGLFLKKEKAVDEGSETKIIYYTEMLEKKICELVSAADGVGSAKVVVTLDGTGEYVFAKDETESNNSYSADYVIVNTDGKEEGVLLSEIYPKVRGVAIVCDGGKSDEVRKRVTELVAAALGISANKIAVSG